MIHATVVVGTRPEVIKMAPVVTALRQAGARVSLIATGQHRDMARQALGIFDLEPDVDLDVMRPDQSLPDLTARLVQGIAGAIDPLAPDAVLVQGDTTSVLAGALAGFYAHIPVGHVEAGLRSHDDDAPWPEEMNRRLTDSISRWCFAPTATARDNLLREGIAADRIHVTGNTGIDALLAMQARLREDPPALPEEAEHALRDHRVVLVTGHRREAFGPPFEALCLAMRRIVDERSDAAVVYPVHLNPNVREPVFRILGDHPRVILTEPLPYDRFVRLMERSDVLLTDSGGIQEEAPALGKPVVVMREVSERTEGVEAGNARVVGFDTDAIVEDVAGLLDSPEAYRARAEVRLPYGDGHAARRIAEIVTGAVRDPLASPP